VIIGWHWHQAKTGIYHRQVRCSYGSYYQSFRSKKWSDMPILSVNFVINSGGRFSGATRFERPFWILNGSRNWSETIGNHISTMVSSNYDITCLYQVVLFWLGKPVWLRYREIMFKFATAGKSHGGCRGRDNKHQFYHKNWLVGRMTIRKKVKMNWIRVRSLQSSIIIAEFRLSRQLKKLAHSESVGDGWVGLEICRDVFGRLGWWCLT